MDRAIEKTIKSLRKEGWAIELARGKHIKAIISRDGFRSPTIVISVSPSDRNAVRNVITDFKKAVKAGGFGSSVLN